jgi:hypothetical protein
VKRRWTGVTCAVLTIVVALALPAAASAATRPQTHTHPFIGIHPLAATQPRLGQHAPLATPTTSANWSGYDDSTDGPFTSVTATWTQPRIRYAGATFTDAAFWVGLDGDGSNTVEQIGSEGYSKGTVGYDAWYEMYPASPVTIAMSIKPGDVLTGTVTETGVATFTLTLVNQTTGKSFSTVQTMSVVPQLASAEVIAEAPTDSNGNVVPLANFGLVSFGDCAFDGQPMRAFNWNQIDMTSQNSGALIDRTSALGADGASFSVTTDLTPPTTAVSGAGTAWHNKPVTLRFVATDNPGGTGVAYTEYSLDDGVTWTKGSSVTIPAPTDHTNDGIHSVLYRSADNAGNLEKARSCTVRIDTRRPTPIANWRAGVVRGHTASLLYYISDHRPGPSTAAVTIRVRTSAGRLVRKLLASGVPVDERLVARFVCLLPRGDYRFLVYATDAAGNRQSRVAANELVVR